MLKTKKLNNNEVDLVKLNEQLEETIRVARQAEASKQSEQSLNELGDIASTTAAAASTTVKVDPSEITLKDQQASESKAPALDELSLDSTEDLDADDRNKRWVVCVSVLFKTY